MAGNYQSRHGSKDNGDPLRQIDDWMSSGWTHAPRDPYDNHGDHATELLERGRQLHERAVADQILTNYQRTPKPRNERVRTAIKRGVGVVLTGAALAGAGFGASFLFKGHSGPAYDKKTETGIENVIKPKMTTAANEAIKLAKKTGIQPVTERGVTTIDIESKDSQSELEVAMRDFPGTHKPNPNDVLAVDARTGFNQGSAQGLFAENEVEYIAPKGTERLPSSLESLWPADRDGWTAIDLHNVGTDGVVNFDLSGTIDTANSQYYAVDDEYNPVGPVGTAHDVANAGVLEDTINALEGR